MTKIISAIRSEAEGRGITRLCHFTPSRNLAHIASDPRGLLASHHLKADEKTVFNPTDVERLDGYTGHLCCSIQYPNAWYFRTARKKEMLFPDWVVVFIKSHYLWRTGTKFCPRNAAAGYGRSVDEGSAAFRGLFAQSVEGNRTYLRGPHHPAFLPTDEQAEVLVPDVIRHDDVIGVAVRDQAQVKQEALRLKISGGKVPRFFVVPEFYSPSWLSSLLRTGRTPAEPEFK